MTETQTPKCADCGDTGYIPPFMDRCPCGAVYVLLDMGEFEYADESFASADPLPDPVGLLVGDFKTDLMTGGTLVWTGDEWKTVPTEVLTPAEYYEKYPEGKTGVTTLVELEADPLDAAEVEFDAEAAATAAELAANDEVVEALDTVAVSATAAGEALAAAADAFTDTWTATKPTAAEITAELTAPPVALTPGRAASPKQIALITRLIVERDPANPVVAAAAKSLATPTLLSAKHASRCIDALMAIPVTVKAFRPNKYDGTCKTCRGHVTAGTGRIEQVDGKWTTFHLAGECVTAEVIAAEDRVTEPGVYWHTEGDGTKVVYRARLGRSSKRLYAEKVFVYPPDADGDRHVDFVYNANAMSFLRAADKLTWKEARDFGALYGNCVACGRNLHDPRSVVQNYGATCASHFGWPTVTLKQAEGIIAGAMTWEEVTGLAL